MTAATHKAIPREVWRAFAGFAVAIAALYCFVLGALSLMWPQNGVDFGIFHAAGLAARSGLNPYLADSLPGPFAYPPNWVPFCVLFSLIPWDIALPLWKTANLIFLVISINLSLRLFTARSLTSVERGAVWVFSLMMWPTISALFTGNTSLLVLLATCAALSALQDRRHVIAGLWVGLALCKPPLVLPLLVWLAYRRKMLPLFVAFSFAGALWLVGLHLTGLTSQEYLHAMAAYSDANPAKDLSTMGLANLVALMTGTSSAAARRVGFLAGIVMLLVLIWLARRNRNSLDCLELNVPLVLMLGPGFFGARTYDLVLLIPAFACFVSLLPQQRFLGWLAISLSMLLLIPQQAMQLIYERALANVFPSPLFAVTLAPFRSWTLLFLIAVSLLLVIRGCRRDQKPAVSRL